MRTTAPGRPQKLIMLPVGIAIVDLAVNKTNADPINPIKFWILCILGIWALSYFLGNFQLIREVRKNLWARIYSITLIAFCLCYGLALLFSPIKEVAFLGFQGRNLGFLTYLFLCCISLYVALSVSLKNIQAIYKVALALCLVLSLYGIFQHFNKDFLTWNNPYNPIVLLSGNPDFAASLLGILVILSAALVPLDSNLKIKILGCLAFLTGLLVIFWTQAKQGLVTAAIGLGFQLIVLIWQRSKKIALMVATLEIVAGALIVLGALQIGPLTRYFFKPSVTDRGYDWRAAIAMFKHHPWFGVGVDQFSSYFLLFRSPNYPLLFGYNTSVNNAHNTLLNFLATAGIFVGISFIALTIYTGFRAYALVTRLKGKSQLTASGLVGSWLAYVAQSVISPDSLTILIWGWVLGGAIIGLSLYISDQDETCPSTISQVKKGQGNSRVHLYPMYQKLVFLAMSIPLLFLVVQMNRVESSVQTFSNIIQPKTPSDIQLYKNYAETIFHQPLISADYQAIVARRMANYAYFPESIRYFKAILQDDPRNMNALTDLAQLYDFLKRPKEAISYRIILSRIDPYGAENLLSLEKDYLILEDRESATHTKNLISSMAPETQVSKDAAKLLSL